MSSSGFSPDGAFPSGASQYASSAAAHETANRALLERVLQETLAAAATGEPLAPEELAALRDVARQHRRHSLDDEPVAAELIEAVLRIRLRTLGGSPEFWRRMSSEIARTLLEDPHARPRLDALWVRLVEEAP